MRHFPAVALLFLLLIALSVAGQSGRKSSPQTPAARPRLEAFVPDPDRDEYRLVFSNGYKELEKGKHKLDLDQQWNHYTASFTGELNKIGAQGYRVTSIALSPRLAVLRRADEQYEYALLQTFNRKRRVDNDAQFGPKYALWAQKGFRVADYFVLYDWCWPGYFDDNGNWEHVDCTYYSQVLLERRKNLGMPLDYEIASAPQTLSKEKLETGLEVELNERKKNLYPTHILTKFQVLMQSSFGVDDNFAGDDYEVEIVGEDVKKRVNQLAQQGYRLILRPHSLIAAVLHRRKGATTPASYIWVSEKKLEQELPRLQQQGAIYRMSDGCATGGLFGPQMIFEQASERDGKQREYKILRLELNELKNVATKRVDFELSSESKNVIAELNRLTEIGFEVRDFFACEMSNSGKRPSRVKILLERVK